MAETTVKIGYDKDFQIKIDKYLKGLDEAVANAMLEISAKVQERLLENMIKYGINSTEIFGGLDIKTLKDSVSIVLNSDYAIFLEFGTGIVGAENPHPNPKKANWVYGNKGWWYPTTQEKQARYPNQPTTYINGQLYAYTKGQESKPFFYETWLYATRISTKIIKKHIRSIKL